MRLKGRYLEYWSSQTSAISTSSGVRTWLWSLCFIPKTERL